MSSGICPFKAKPRTKRLNKEMLRSILVKKKVVILDREYLPQVRRLHIARIQNS